MGMLNKGGTAEIMLFLTDIWLRHVSSFTKDTRIYGSRV